MKSYSEVIEGYSFNWNKFLNQEYKDFDSECLHQAAQCSNKWTTCACGTQCSILPRHSEDGFDENGKWQMSGSPVDKELRELGMEFNNMIESMEENYFHEYKYDFEANRQNAKSILLQIELRSSYLINEIKKQAK